MLDGTYTGLQASIADFLNRADLSATIPDFIVLAEAQMNTRLTTHDMWFVRTLTLTSETLKLPCDLLSVESFRLNQGGGPDYPEGGRITYRTPQQMDDLPVGFSGCPKHYTIAGGCFVFWPIPAPPASGQTAYTARLRARERIPSLSTSNPSNWLLAKYPHAYLYGALTQAAPYLIDDDRLETWGGLFEKALTDIAEAEKRLVSDSLQTVSGVGDGHRRSYGYNPF